MKTFDLQEFNDILKRVDLKPRFKKELRFISSVASMPTDWSRYELVSIKDRTGDAGVLLLQPNEDIFVAQYELSRRIVDASTGRDRAIICDFCYTWQPGSNAASITFNSPRIKQSVRLLCCADLNCSEHVRTMTKAAKLSRTQLRENMTDESRIARLKHKLAQAVDQLKLEEIKEL